MAEIVGLLLGVTGPLEQITTLALQLRHNHIAFKSNPRAIQSLTETCLQLHSLLNSLPSHYRGNIPPYESANLNDEVARINSVFSEILEQLSEISTPGNRISEYARATGYQNMLSEMESSMQQTRAAFLRVSNILAIHDHIDCASSMPRDVFSPCCNAPRNPESVMIDLNSKSNGIPDTSESRLKAALLRLDFGSCVGVVAVGKGWLGKTCTLREIAHDPDVVSRFTGGVYFMPLDKDVTLSTIMEQLCSSIEISGGERRAAKLRWENRFEYVVAGAHVWFSGHACLFIFDGLWSSNDVSSEAIDHLSILIGNSGSTSQSSRILYSTREEALVPHCERIFFRSRSHYGAVSVNILMHTAGADFSELYDPNCRPSILRILDICAGIPLAINVSGSGVRYMRARWHGEKKEVWRQYIDSIDGSHHILHTSADNYPSLASSLLASLAILNCSTNAFSSERKELHMSYFEMHRALCVLKKQDWVPRAVLKLVWCIFDDGLVEEIAKEMDRVGVADVEYRKDLGPGLRLHDLTHDFSLFEAARNEGLENWYGKLLDRFLRSECTDEKYLSNAQPYWPALVRDNHYFSQNMYRLLMCAGREAEACALLMNAEWVLKAIHNGTLSQYQQDVKNCIQALKQNKGKTFQFECLEVEDVIIGMKLISNAARLSILYCDSIGTAAFQMCDRLHGSPEKAVQKFIAEIWKETPGPWSAPTMKCLTGVDGSAVENIRVPYDIEFVKLTERGLMSCGGWFETTSILISYLPDMKTDHIRLNKIRQKSDTVREHKEHESGMRRILKDLKGLFRGSDSLPTEDIAVGGHNSQWFVSADISLDGSVLVSGHRDGTIIVWNIDSKEHLNSFKAHTGRVTCISISGNGKRIVSGSVDNTVKVWELESGQQVGNTLTGHEDSIRSVEISEDGNTAASGSHDGAVRVWNVKTGRQIGATINGQANYANCLAMSADGRRLVSASDEHAVKVWDAETGFQVGKELVGHSNCVFTVAMSKDGMRAASGSLDRTVRVWDVESGNQIEEALTGHEKYINSVGISMDRKLVVSSSGDHTVRIWDLEGGKEVREALAGLKGRVLSLSRSADGRRVASSSDDPKLSQCDHRNERIY